MRRDRLGSLTLPADQEAAFQVEPALPDAPLTRWKLGENPASVEEGTKEEVTDTIFPFSHQLDASHPPP